MASAVGPSFRGSWREWMRGDIPVRVGVSACLLGEPVRYDQGHKRFRFLTDRLARWVSFVPVCPEAESGMGIPRPTIRLEQHGDSVRVIAPDTGDDHTARLDAFAARRIGDLAAAPLDGYVFKSRSPSCGVFDVPVYRGGMPVRRDASGTFAAAVRDRWPYLPVEEEGRLADPLLRGSFLERVFAAHRWRVFLAEEPDRDAFLRFHAAHEFLVRSHGDEGYIVLARIVAAAGTPPDRESYAAYGAALMRALTGTATVESHGAALRSLLVGLETKLDSRERGETLALVEEFAHGLVPLNAPRAALRNRAAEREAGEILGQIYLDPYPEELLTADGAGEAA